MTDNHPAFPINGGSDIWNQYEGLTKRELIAALMLQGLLANGKVSHVDRITSAVSYADRLIAALGEK